MFVKKAWGFTSEKEIGLKSFDSVHRISIDIISEPYQNSVFIGNSKSTLYGRQVALEAIGNSSLSEKFERSFAETLTQNMPTTPFLTLVTMDSICSLNA